MKILNLKSKILNHKEKGFVVSIVAFFLLTVMMTIALSIGTLIFYRQKSATNIIKSTQSYYAAESGIEDSLIRLKNSPQMAPISYSL
ncbi:MAG: hypothetical protein AAB877_01495, partial [Patescibacteria group bacterium]